MSFTLKLGSRGNKRAFQVKTKYAKAVHIHVYNTYNFIFLKIIVLSPAGKIGSKPNTKKQGSDCEKMDIDESKGEKKTL